MRADGDEVDLDDEPLDAADLAAAIEALRAARSAGFGDRDRRFTGRRHRPGTGDYE